MHVPAASTNSSSLRMWREAVLCREVAAAGVRTRGSSRQAADAMCTACCAFVLSLQHSTRSPGNLQSTVMALAVSVCVRVGDHGARCALARCAVARSGVCYTSRSVGAPSVHHREQAAHFCLRHPSARRHECC